MNPMPHFDFDAMRRVDIRSVDPASLADIRDIDIKPDLPFVQKAVDYIMQIRNAYCFRCGDVTVKINHPKTTTTINDCMEGFFQTV